MEKKTFSDFLFRSEKMAAFWLLVRLYVGLVWLEAALTKVGASAWTGEGAGTAVTGFLKGALAKTGGAHPDVQWWYASFIEKVALPNATVFSYVVAFGELFVAIGLILGVLTGVTAFFAALMNMSYLLSGTVSTNPILLVLAVALMLAWRTAGLYGLDRYLLPYWRRKRQNT